MWPWGHLTVAYVAYSLGCRALGREPPTGTVVVALGIASVTPDLIDKPLSWGLGWFATGYAVGHSLVFAVPAGLVVLAVAAGRPRSRWPVALVVGYWLHLLADVLSPIRAGDGLAVERVLWPVADATPYETDQGIGRGLVYLERFVANLAGMDPWIFALSLLAPAAAVGLWLADGAPGTELVHRATVALRRRW